jgi:anti-anti-sigma regulatory factor
MSLAIPTEGDGESMLKITTLTKSGSSALRLEGRLAGPWVEVLEQCWDSVAGTATNHPPSVDLSAVTFVDSDGKELLRKLYQQGAQLIASGCLTRCIVNEIVQVVRVGDRAK